MAGKIRLEIVTPDAVLVSEDVDEVIAVGHRGQFGVLPGHRQMLSSVEIGGLSFRKDKSVTYLALGGGYAEVGPDKVTILAETAEFPKDIDVVRAGQALNNAQEAIKDLFPDDKKFEETELALERAKIRLEIAKK